MADDLVKRETLLGRPVDEVQRILGRPDKDYASALVYKIDLGWPFKNPNTYALNIYLGAHRKVREVKIVD